MACFTNPGEGEAVKGAVHGALMTLLALCAAYNASAFSRRRERHLALNALLYTAGIVYEMAQVRHHCR